MKGKPDPIWDVMVLLFGIPISSSEKGRRNKLVKELKGMMTALGCDTEESMAAAIQDQYANALTHWQKQYITDASLVAYWSRFNVPANLVDHNRQPQPADWALDAAAAKRKEL